MPGVANTNEDRQLAAYREHVGEEAAERQRAAALKVWPCCGWRRDQGHHPICVNAPKDSR